MCFRPEISPHTRFKYGTRKSSGLCDYFLPYSLFFICHFYHLEFFIQLLFFLHSSVLFLGFWCIVFFYLQVFLAELRPAAGLALFLLFVPLLHTLHFQSLRGSIHGAHSACKVLQIWYLVPSGGLAEGTQMGLSPCRKGQTKAPAPSWRPRRQLQGEATFPGAQRAGFLRSHTHPQLLSTGKSFHPAIQMNSNKRGVVGLSWCLAQPFQSCCEREREATAPELLGAGRAGSGPRPSATATLGVLAVQSSAPAPAAEREG